MTAAGTQLQQLIELRIPFGIVCANSTLGASNFFVVLDSDCRQYPALTGFTTARAGVRHKYLSSADLVGFNRLKSQGHLEQISLGESGTAYELSDRPFRSLYRTRIKGSYPLKLI